MNKLFCCPPILGTFEFCQVYEVPWLQIYTSRHHFYWMPHVPALLVSTFPACTSALGCWMLLVVFAEGGAFWEADIEAVSLGPVVLALGVWLSKFSAFSRRVMNSGQLLMCSEKKESGIWHRKKILVPRVTGQDLPSLKHLFEQKSSVQNRQDHGRWIPPPQWTLYVQTFGYQTARATHEQSAIPPVICPKFYPYIQPPCQKGSQFLALL